MKKIIYTSVVFCILLSHNLYSQQTEKIIATEKDKNGIIMFARLQENQPSNEVIDNALLKELLSLPNEIEYRTIDSLIDKSGMVHKAYQQYYMGFKVIGGDYVFHVKDGSVKFINGTYIAIENDIATKPFLSEKEAELIALNSIKSRNTEKGASLLLNSEFKELAILKDWSTKQIRLVFKILIDATNDMISEIIYVDALNGKVLLTENLFCSFLPPNAIGSAQTSYSGTQTITTDVIGNQFRMREDRNGVNIITRNANHSSSFINIPTTATDIFDNDNNWLANEHGSDRVAYDVHWGIEQTFDYWLNVHGRNSFNGNGMDVNSYFHFNSGNGADNAFWHRVTNSMYYGDGHSIFRPLVSLDVCAHEFGHGISQFSVPGGGFGSSGESPALNEGFSDIWGASVEAWAAPTKQRWMIGEEIMNNGKNSLRNMQNPNDPNSQTQGPDT